MMNLERFSTGFVLPFTHPSFVMSLEILNLESKVGTLNPESFAVQKEIQSRSRIDGDWWRLLVASSFSHRFRRRKLNVDVLHTLLEMTMARSKIWMILKDQDKCQSNNSVVSEWKENFGLSKPTPRLFFWQHFDSHCRGNQQLVNHFIMNVPGVVILCKRLGIRISF